MQETAGLMKGKVAEVRDVGWSGRLRVGSMIPSLSSYDSRCLVFNGASCCRHPLCRLHCLVSILARYLLPLGRSPLAHPERPRNQAAPDPKRNTIAGTSA